MILKRAGATAIAGAALTLMAFVFGAAPLFVPGIAFLALGLCAPGWVWLSLRGASVERRLGAERVIEGEPIEASIGVRRGRLAPGGAGLEVHDPLAEAPIRMRKAGRARGRTHTITLTARFEGRGSRDLAPPSIASTDALGLARAVRSGVQPSQELLVLPRTEPVRRSAIESAGRAGPAGPDALVRAELLAAVEVDGLRPYRPGTPASRIHWSALARGAGLLERRLAPEEDFRPLVVLDARGSGPPEHLDAAVRAAASLTLALARTRGCALLLGGDRRPIAVDRGLAGWPGAHARLALVQGGTGAQAPALGRVWAGQPACVFYVAAQAPGRLPQALQTASARGAVALVLPQPLSPQTPAAPSFALSGCRGFVLARRAHGPAREGIAHESARAA